MTLREYARKYNKCAYCGSKVRDIGSIEICLNETGYFCPNTDPLSDHWDDYHVDDNGSFI